MNLNVEDMYKNIGQLPQGGIDLLLQKASTYERKLAADFKIAKQQLPTLEKKFTEVRILFEIGALDTTQFLSFKTRLQNMRHLVTNYPDLMRTVNTVRRELGKLKPSNSPGTNYLKSDEERETERQPRESLSAAHEGDANRMENGAGYAATPDEPLMGEAE